MIDIFSPPLSLQHSLQPVQSPSRWRQCVALNHWNIQILHDAETVQADHYVNNNCHLVYLEQSADSYLYASDIWCKFSELIKKDNRKFGLKQIHHGYC